MRKINRYFVDADLQFDFSKSNDFLKRLFYDVLNKILLSSNSSVIEVHNLKSNSFILELSFVRATFWCSSSCINSNVNCCNIDISLEIKFYLISIVLTYHIFQLTLSILTLVIGFKIQNSTTQKKLHHSNSTWFDPFVKFYEWFATI